MKKNPASGIILIVKILVCLALCYVLGSKLYNEASRFKPEDYLQILSKTEVKFFLLFSLLLMPVNWMLETAKWKMIVSESLEEISFAKAFRSVFTGVAFGNLAPGRATEFAGKILFISAANRVEATFLHFVTGSTQLMVTILFGSIGMIFSSFKFPGSETLNLVFIVLLILLFGLLLSFFFNPTRVFSFLLKIRWFKKYAHVKINISRKTLFKLAFLSVSRHLVFSVQYFLIIISFFSSADYASIICGIFVSLLLVSVVPMFSPVEAFMRGGIGVLVFSSVETNSMHIFISSSLIWIINILLPSLAGLIFFLVNKSEHKKRSAS